MYIITCISYNKCTMFDAAILICFTYRLCTRLGPVIPCMHSCTHVGFV